MVTAEFAVALPAVVLVLALCLAGLSAVTDQIRCIDAAGLAVRSAARGDDPSRARTLAVEAAVLLMDEPLANLDPPHQADWLATARELAAAGCAVVSVLHELHAALAADALVVMAAGRIAHHGPAADPATHRALEAVFDHRVAVHQVAGEFVALAR